MKGKFIVFEGGDGAGKKTQTDLLSKKLGRIVTDVKVFSFPRYDTPAGKKVREYLEGALGDPTIVDPYIAAMLYAQDQKEAGPQIRKLLGKGIWVIADRYEPSNEAFQSAKLPREKRKEFLSWLRALEYEQFHIPRPDFVLYLEVPAKISGELIRDRVKDKHEEDLSYQEEVRKVYKELASELDWAVIPCMENDLLRMPQDIAQNVWQRVEKLL